MFKLKKIMCVILSVAMILTVSPIEAFADEVEGGIVLDENLVDGELIEETEIAEEEENVGEESIETSKTDEESVEDSTTSDEEKTEEQIGKEESTTDESESLTDEELYEELEGELEGELEEEPIEELSEEEDAAESEDILATDEADEKEYFIEGKVEGVDYEAGVVCAYVDTVEEAEKIADEYEISLKEYNCPIALFELPEDVSVAKIVTLSDSVLFPNYYGRVSNLCTLQDINADDEVMRLSSYIVDENENYSDPYLKDHVNDVDYIQWHHDVIGSPYAWKSKITGSEVKIAILSSGMNEHSDFDTFDNTVVFHKNILMGYDEGATDKSNCTDNCGNGTALAGIIGANYGNSKLGAGVAPGAQLLNIKITDNGSVKINNVIAGIDEAITMDADIILIDACFDGMVPALQTKITSAYDNGIAVFAPAAYGADQYEVWPAACDHVIAVGASNKCNQRMGSAAYSNHIDIVAPGEKISTCAWNNYASYLTTDGPLLAAGIAAGEAALILSYKDRINAFYKNGSLIDKSPALVDALEKHMKASTISAGSGTGSGIVYLPKALSLGTITDGPKAPIIYAPGTYSYGFYVANVDGVDVLKFLCDLQTNNYDSDFPRFYYTLDGKTPSYKNGKKDAYSQFTDSTVNAVVDPSKNSLTIKAILVDHMGVASPVATYTVPMNFVKQIKISTTSSQAYPEVVKGKKIKFTASTLPSNSYAKAVTWHISYNESEQEAKNQNVTISSSGEVITKSNSTIGDYEVWAVSKNDPTMESKKMTIKVREGGVISKINVLKKKDVKYRENVESEFDSEFNLITDMINPIRVDGNPFESTTEFADLYFTSSNPKVVKVYNDGSKWLGVLKGPGKANITVCDAYGMGVKATYSVEVVQRATEVRIVGDTYNKVSRGKSISLKSTITPDNSKIKTLSWSVCDAEGNPITVKGLKVSNGKVTTSKTTPTGEYYIKAELKNPGEGGSIISAKQKIEVIDAVVTKITPSVKNITIFSDNNNIADENDLYLTNGEFLVDVEGGEPVTEGGSLLNAFSITSSSDNLLICTPSLLNGKIKVWLSATGNGYGKATVTIAARDGSGKKATVTVNVINPVSSVKIAPAKAGVNNAVVQGKTLQLKATLGEGYGKISNKNVSWSIPDESDRDFVKINSKGLVTALPDSNISGTKRSVTIRATAADGSFAYGDTVIDIYKPVGKMEVCSETGETGKQYPAKGQVTNNVGKSGNDLHNYIDFYIKVKDTGAPLSTASDGDFVLSSANSALATIKPDGTWKPEDHKAGDYYIYKFNAICVLSPDFNKSGSAKLTIKTKDGSQSVAYTLKVVK